MTCMYMSIENRFFVWFYLYIQICESMACTSQEMTEIVEREMRGLRVEVEIMNTVGDALDLEAVTMQQIALDKLFFSASIPLRVYNKKRRRTYLSHNERVGTLYSAEGESLYDILSTFSEISIFERGIQKPKKKEEFMKMFFFAPKAKKEDEVMENAPDSVAYFEELRADDKFEYINKSWCVTNMHDAGLYDALFAFDELDTCPSIFDFIDLLIELNLDSLYACFEEKHGKIDYISHSYPEPEVYPNYIYEPTRFDRVYYDEGEETDSISDGELDENESESADYEPQKFYQVCKKEKKEPCYFSDPEYYNAFKLLENEYESEEILQQHSSYRKAFPVTKNKISRKSKKQFDPMTDRGGEEDVCTSHQRWCQTRSALMKFESESGIAEVDEEEAPGVLFDTYSDVRSESMWLGRENGCDDHESVESDAIKSISETLSFLDAVDEIRSIPEESGEYESCLSEIDLSDSDSSTETDFVDPVDKWFDVTLTPYSLKLPFTKCLFIFGLDEDFEFYYKLVEGGMYGFVFHFHARNVFFTRLILANMGLPIV